MSLAPDYSSFQRSGTEEVKEIIIIKEEVKEEIKEECKKEHCELKCDDPCNSGWGWESFGIFVLSFIVLIVLFWIVFYSLKPPFVLQSDSNQVDTAKVLLAAVISAFVLVILIWLIKAVFSS